MTPTTDQEVVDALAEVLGRMSGDWDPPAGWRSTDPPAKSYYRYGAADMIDMLRSRGFDIIRKE